MKKASFQLLQNLCQTFQDFLDFCHDLKMWGHYIISKVLLFVLNFMRKKLIVFIYNISSLIREKNYSPFWLTWIFVLMLVDFESVRIVQCTIIFTCFLCFLPVPLPLKKSCITNKQTTSTESILFWNNWLVSFFLHLYKFILHIWTNWKMNFGYGSGKNHYLQEGTRSNNR